MSKKRSVTNLDIMIKLEDDDERKGRVDTAIAEIHECIYGDGNPEKGMVFRVTTLEKFYGVVKKLVWMIVGALVVGGIGYYLFA